MIQRVHEAKLFPVGRSLKDSGVVIQEYFGFDISFESDDPDARLYVEKLVDDGEETILPGQTVSIMPPGNSEEMIVPGEYLLRMTTRSGTFEAFYTVVSKNYSTDAIRNMRFHLEKLLKGLTYQLERKRFGIYTSNIDLPPTAFFILDKIIENYNALRYYLDSINNNPITDVRKGYKEMVGSKRPDAKSIRWLLGKGASRSPTPSSPIVVNEKHTFLSSNNIENRWIVQIVQYLQRSLRLLAVCMKENVMAKEQQILKLMKEKLELEQKINRQLSNPLHTFSDYRKGINELIKSKERIETEKIPQLQRELSVMNQKRQKLISITATLMQLEKNGWYQEVKNGKAEKATLRMLKDPRYSFLYNFYKELRQLEDEKVTNQKAVYPRKKNSLLLEYYTLSLVIDILLKQDYQWKEGWLADNPNPLLADLPSGEIMRFDADDHYILLSYDSEIERRSQIDSDSSYSRFVCGYDCRPDIRLSIHDKETDSILSAQIIEVKYRRFQYLYNKDIQTKVMEQCFRYNSIEYFDATTGRPRPIVDNVIVVYPRQERVPPVQGKQGNSIVFIQIEPCDPNTDQIPFGYEDLKDKILHFINEHTEKGGTKVG